MSATPGADVAAGLPPSHRERMFQAMERRKLGESDIYVSPLGLGCWQFAQGNGLISGYWAAMEQPEIDSVVKTALDGGINWFDTAEAYGRGTSERALAAALRANDVAPGDVVVATKWMPVLRFAGSIGRTIDDRIDALRPFHIDLHQIHNPASFSSIAKQMSEMAELVSRGAIRTVGVSNFSARQMREAHRELAGLGIPLVSNQILFNLLDRSIEENGVLETAKELGITLIAYSPLAQGLLTGKFHADPTLIKKRSGPRKFLPRFRRLERTEPLVKRLESLAEQHDVSPAQIALNWTVNVHGETVVAIPGASSPEQAKSNAACLEFRLADDEITELSELGTRVSKS